MIVLHSRKSDGYLSAGALLAGIVTFIVYVPALKNGFVSLDYEWYITNNPYITGLNADFFRWAFSEFYAKNWHPLTWLSHAIDYAIYGFNPSGHHFTSIVFHSIASMGVVILSFRVIAYAQLVTDIGYKFDRMQTLLAAVVSGIIFGIHSLHVESVAWVSERKDVLCAVFYIFSIISYLKYAEGSSIVNRTNLLSYLFDRRYLLALTLFLLALLSKPIRNFLAVAYINIGNMDDAYRELAIALKLSPNLFFTYNNLGLYYEMQGKIDDACNSYQQALRLNKDFINAQNKTKELCL